VLIGYAAEPSFVEGLLWRFVNDVLATAVVNVVAIAIDDKSYSVFSMVWTLIECVNCFAGVEDPCSKSPEVVNVLLTMVVVSFFLDVVVSSTEIEY